jgi:phage host-nuclease inhibitor protein Gam
MSTMTQIDILTRTYAEARGKLAALVQELQTEMEFIRRKRIAPIKRLVAATADAHAALQAAISEGKDLFVKPRSVTIAGVKVGIQQKKPGIEIDDEDAVIARIREQLPKDQVELLLRVKTTVDRSALIDLSDADLKRLGVRRIEAVDQVLIKPVDTEVDKLVDALMREAEQAQDEAA